MLTQLRVVPNELRGSAFDLVVDGESAGQVRTTVGNVLNIDLMQPENVTLDTGEPATIRFDGLDHGSKDIEIWLPQAATVELRSLRIDDEAVAEPASRPTGRRWVHYGSSISHCLEAASPTTTWPAVAAHHAGVELISLGFAGQCMLDQFVARTIRDLEPDVISVKIGINVVNGDTMRERTFGPAVHGFLDTIRERLPDTPMLVVSPIYCPPAEDKPGPTVPGPEGKYIVVEGLDELRSTCLTLRKVRTCLEQVVDAATRRRRREPALPERAGVVRSRRHTRPTGRLAPERGRLYAYGRPLRCARIRGRTARAVDANLSQEIGRALIRRAALRRTCQGLSRALHRVRVLLANRLQEGSRCMSPTDSSMRRRRSERGSWPPAA